MNKSKMKCLMTIAESVNPMSNLEKEVATAL